MLNFSEINNFPTYDGGAFDILKEVAGKYCPEEVKEIRRGVIPDESLNLENLEKEFMALLAGGDPYQPLPYIGEDQNDEDARAGKEGFVTDGGFGIGLPETQKLKELNYK